MGDDEFPPHTPVPDVQSKPSRSFYRTIKVVTVLYVNATFPRTSAQSVAFPALVQRAGKNAIFADGEFFSASLSHTHTQPPSLWPSRGELSCLVRTARDQAAPGDAGASTTSSRIILLCLVEVYPNLTSGTGL